MMRLDIPSLRLFVAAVDQKSLSRGAERENVVTSAASKRVTELERQLGTTLLRRHGRGVEPTPAGVVLYQRAKAILRSVQLAEEAITGFSRQGSPKIRLAANRSTIVQFLPGELRAFLEGRPGTQIDLMERMSGDIPRIVNEGEADIGIYHASGPATGVASHPYHVDRVVLVVPRGHPLEVEGGVFLEQAIDYDFIGYFPRHSYEAFLHLAERSLSRPLSIRLQVSDFEARCRMVHEGLGIAMMPQGVGRAHLKALGLVQVRLKDDWALRQFFVCVRDARELRPAVAELLDHFVTAEASGRTHGSTVPHPGRAR